MKKELCLRSTSDFHRVFREGKRFLSPRFVLYISRNKLLETRLGVSISKSHLKLATRRNKIRRMVKELFRNEICSNLKGYDLVVTSRSHIAKTNIKAAGNEIKTLLAKARP